MQNLSHVKSISCKIYLMQNLSHVKPISCSCGPFPPALEALRDPQVKQLVHGMLHGEYALKVLGGGGHKGTKTSACGVPSVHVVYHQCMWLYCYYHLL